RIGGMVETELFPGARYDKVAEAFGCHSALVTSLDELQPALQAAVDSGLPALIQVMIEPGANLAPPGLMDFGNLVYRGTDREEQSHGTPCRPGHRRRPANRHRRRHCPAPRLRRL